MQLNSGSSGPSLQSEINITPLVDVVLVLLIIFMVVVPLLMKGYDVSVPQTTAEPAGSEDSQLMLSIGPTNCPILEPPAGEGIPANCSVTLDDQKIPATEVPARVAEILGGRPPEKRVLFLAVDDSLNYEGVLRIVDLAKSSVEDLKIEFVTTH
jgi:biopolymer transport protein TolR